MHIFISYSRYDTTRANEFVAIFAQLGVTCWLDSKSIHVGEIWREEIVKGITDCSLFLILLSRSSIISDNVRKELDIAESCKKLIIPILLEEVQLPAKMQYQLAGVQHLLLNDDVQGTAMKVLEAYKDHTPATSVSLVQTTVQPQQLKPVIVSKRILREKLSGSFSINEIDRLCFEIQSLLEDKNVKVQLNLDVLGGRDQGKDALILALIGFLERRGYLQFLQEGIQSLRPDIFSQ